MAASQAYELREEAVAIPARALVLEGTLSAPRAHGRFPAVVLLHGSGPLGRDEAMPGQLGVSFGFEVPIFRELAHHLARAGFVVIRYDKRTCTPAQGCANSYPEVAASFDDILDDAQAVIDWLRRRPEVDPGALYLIGHSLGGACVPELMTDNPDLRAGVLLAAPYRPVDELSAYQNDYAVDLLRHQDMHPLVIGVRVRELEEIAVGTRRLRAGTFSGGKDIGGAPAAFWQAWMDLGDALPALVDRLDRPLLALSGDADSNVPPSETELWRRRLAAVRPDPGHETAVLPCVSHALNCMTGQGIAGRHLAPAVVERTLRFLRKQ